MSNFDEESSRITAIRRQLKANAQDKSEKCQHCFLFEKLCDKVKPTCGSCAHGKRICKPQKVAPRRELRLPNTQDLWDKCVSCQKSGRRCFYTGSSLRCVHCEKQKLICVNRSRPISRPGASTLRPVHRTTVPQPKEHKCRACFDFGRFCDRRKPKCGKCEKFGYICVPRGTPQIRPVHRDDKCRNCRQRTRACSHKLPCELCKKAGIECRPSLNEEAFAREGEAEEARAREAERAEFGDDEMMHDQMADEALVGENMKRESSTDENMNHLHVRAKQVMQRRKLGPKSQAKARKVGTVDFPIKIDSDSDEGIFSALATAQKQKVPERRRQPPRELRRIHVAPVLRMSSLESDEVKDESGSEYDPANDSGTELDMEDKTEGSATPPGDRSFETYPDNHRATKSRGSKNRSEIEMDGTTKVKVKSEGRY